MTVVEWLRRHKNAPVQKVERFLNRAVKGGSCGGCGHGCSHDSTSSGSTGRSRQDAEQCEHFKWWILSSTATKSVGVCIIRRGFAARIHCHKPEESYHVLRGRALMRVGDRLKVLTAGERVRIPPGHKHALTALSPVVILLFSFKVPFEQVKYKIFRTVVRAPDKQSSKQLYTLQQKLNFH